MYCKQKTEMENNNTELINKQSAFIKALEELFETIPDEDIKQYIQ